MTALPSKSVLDGTSNPTTAAMKAAKGQLHDYLSGLLGADGTPATARSGLSLANHEKLAVSATGGLTITNTGAGNSLVVEDASSDTTPFVIDSGGNMIVGDLTPAVMASGQPKVQMVTLAGTVVAGLRGYNASNAAVVLEFAKSRQDTLGHTIVQSGDDLASLRFSGSDGTGFVRAAQINVQVDGTPGVGSMPGRLVFSTTAAGSSSPAEAMQIDSVQRVIAKSGVAYKPTRSTVASGSTIVLTNATSHLLYDNAATAAALTVTLPSASLADGQEVTIATRSAITALTVNGGTIYGAPTTLAAGGNCTFIYSSAAIAWFLKG